jgi:hypothetical protein
VVELMPDTSPLVITSKAGIKRDGTQLEGDYYVDGQWVRFQRGLPRKMGGYRRLLTTLTGPPRELEVYTSNGVSYCHSGSGSKLERFLLDEDHSPISPISDRTPAGFVVDADNDWQFAEVYDTAAAQLRLLAVANPTCHNPDSSATHPIYFGDAYGTAALVAVGSSPGSDVSGGIMGLQTYAVAYGSNGAVNWSVSNAPTDFAGLGSGAVNVTDQKIIQGLPLRGGGQSPAALLWSLNALLRMSFVGGGPVWQFDTLSSQSSILSANSVIEYDGIYYWMGVDRFLMFSGVLQELDNDLNLNYVFDNLNTDARGKAFAFKVPRYGEIWWCLPMFGSDEPNVAIIYNVRESRRLGYPVWYDTMLPDDLRGAAHYPTGHPHPLLTAARPVSGLSTYALWHHEDGVDRVEGTSVLAVPSWFETADMSLWAQQQPLDKGMHVEMVEPDFVQSGDMTYQVSGRMNARSPQIYSDEKTFPDTATGPTDEVVYVKEQRRELRHKFKSNVAGGDYQMGEPVVHIAPADGRRTS